jgi:hypothetical protein
MTTFSSFRGVRFLLADDAGAGKTIMSGLLIRELNCADSSSVS